MPGILARSMVLVCALLWPLAMPARASGGPDLRLIALRSPALGGQTEVRILLPDGYATSAIRYPVLYLLHGYGGSSYDWPAKTDLPEFARHLPLIVVMPDGGNGWYMDPAGAGARWETYHIKELIPYIDGHFRTIARRGGRAIAGLSMGGMGAFSYAARYPDLFVAAASFSGVLAFEDFNNLSRLVQETTARERWVVRGHDPVNLAGNLRGLRLFISAGNGSHGPLDNRPAGAVDVLERTVHAGLLSMEAALRSVHVPVTVDDYGPGTHEWPYWQRELHRAMPLLLAALATPPAPPAPWSYRTADASAGVWGYSMSVERPGGTYGFTDLTDVGLQGLTVTGSGTISLLTALIYRPGRSYWIRQDRAPSAAVAADTYGRLRLTIPLGGATATAHVSIGGSPAP